MIQRMASSSESHLQYIVNNVSSCCRIRSYVSKSESQSRGLAYVNRDGNFVMQVDNTTSISPNSNQGRKSVRLHSNDLMGDGIILAKINWMPQGCA